MAMFAYRLKDANVYSEGTHPQGRGVPKVVNFFHIRKY